jgi:hypothetical protein
MICAASAMMTVALLRARPLQCIILTSSFRNLAALVIAVKAGATLTTAARLCRVARLTSAAAKCQIIAAASFARLPPSLGSISNRVGDALMICAALTRKTVVVLGARSRQRTTLTPCGGICTLERCCTPLPTCASYTCTGDDVVNNHSLKCPPPKYNPKGASGGGCTPQLCCISRALSSAARTSSGSEDSFLIGICLAIILLLAGIVGTFYMAKRNNIISVVEASKHSPIVI